MPRCWLCGSELLNMDWCSECGEHQVHQPDLVDDHVEEPLAQMIREEEEELEEVQR